jgi:hypothetical protein
MEKLIKELKKIVPFKDTTDTGDLVLLVAKEPQMLVYALVTGIEADNSRKDEWWKVEMRVLSVPPQPLTWTLRLPQFTGQEIFTMGGEERFVQAVDFDAVQPLPDPAKPTKKKPGLRIVK